MEKLTADKLFEEIIGAERMFLTPYGERVVTYADFTASGKPLKFIEKYLLKIQEFYANSHTEDDITGETMTSLLHKAENIIKKEVNGLGNCSVIATGTGSTGAIIAFSKIVGLYMAPATKKRLMEMSNSDNKRILQKLLNGNDTEKSPVVFVGPYEHHSNILSWRESLAEVVTIGLTEDGYLDLDDLKSKLEDSRYSNRYKVGSFSASSNVTGVITPVYEVAKILHQHDALACFDFAASGPYVNIDMNKDAESYFDAIYLSPHKFIGGPGSAGLLIINNRIYDKSLPPTNVGGGTVDYVSEYSQDYIVDIEEREKAGTPGIIQIIKAALALQLKGTIGTDNIEKIEEEYSRQFFDRFGKNENIKILGPTDYKRRVSIISFVVKYQDKYLHPRFVTILLNDLFGIQSRAGCSCAGPYGHRLLGIDNETSEKFREAIQSGASSLKPGWVRINLHYTMTQEMVNFLMDAIEHIINNGHLYLQEYEVNLRNGSWSHINKIVDRELIDDFGVIAGEKIGTEHIFSVQKVDFNKEYTKYISEANNKAEILANTFDGKFGSYEIEEYDSINWFYFNNSTK
jgi:selenocysteine lyase/cysteine desulfurase